MSPRSRVIVVGDVMVDVVVRPDSAINPTSDTPSTVRIGRGGAAANLAVALRRFAPVTADVVFVGCRGDDLAGTMVAEALDAAGVTPALVTVPGSTGVVVSLVDASGQRAMMTDRGVNAHLALAHLDDLFDESVAHLHVSGYLVLDPATRAVAMALLRRARSSGVTSSVDVCSLGPLLAMGPATFLAAVADASVLFANEEEAVALSGVGADGAALRLAATFDEVLVTHGANGAEVITGDEGWYQPSQADVVVDTTGAGDAATGAYLGARLSGESADDALAMAMAAAARVVAGLGSEG